jgi:hypothetical protein
MTVQVYVVQVTLKECQDDVAGASLGARLADEPCAPPHVLLVNIFEAYKPRDIPRQSTSAHHGALERLPRTESPR